MVVKIFINSVSPPCRAVMMTAAHIGIHMEIKEDNFIDGQIRDDLLKINPRACVPTIDDNGFYLWESRAIMTYLANKYAPCDPLYPREPKMRALVDMMLSYDLGTLYKAQVDYLYPIVFFMEPMFPTQSKIAYKNALAFLENTLKTQKYMAGDYLTLADLSISANISLSEVYDFDFSGYTNLQRWSQMLRDTLPYFKEINDIPLFQFKFTTGNQENPKNKACESLDATHL